MKSQESMAPRRWPSAVHETLREHGVLTVGYVPDAGLKDLLLLCQGDPSIRDVPLTTEEEGVGLAMGTWLGGGKSVLLLQSSGIGNLVNVLGAVRECALPLVMLGTMRGEEGELNPWQVPLGRAVPAILESMGVLVRRVDKASDVGPALDTALRRAYENDDAVAVLLSQRMLGIKSFRQEAEG
jgi:sulfopyruvate decarboxylase alpha subunit